MIKAVIFDLDGTLLDTLTSIHFYLNKTLRENGYAEISREDCRRFIGNGARVLVQRALRSVGEEDEAVLARVLSQYNAAYDADPYYLTEPYEGIMPLLTTLSARGVRLGVLSNKPDPTVCSLSRHFFGDLFSESRGGCEGVPLKPDPVALSGMLMRLGVLPSELLYVGDSGVDIETGRAVGAALTVGVSWGFRDTDELIGCGADTVVNPPEQILTLLS